jgi:hypothetical protein
MENYKPINSYESAENYDQYHIRGDENETVSCLTELARGGPALELAIGTGRIALPLYHNGIKVDGIDFSTAMIEKLRMKPGGKELNIKVDDFSNVDVDGNYRLIYIVFNTLFNLLTQEDQVRCFVNVASHLTNDGLFVVEGGLPTEFCRHQNYQYIDLDGINIDRVFFDVAQYDPITQVLDEMHINFSNTGTRLGPIVTRYAWPAELDLMARIAGLKLKNRWANWNKCKTAPDSKNCISIYGF